MSEEDTIEEEELTEEATEEVTTTEEATEEITQANVTVETLGASPMVWLETIYKRLTEAAAGRAGLEAICSFLDNVDFVPELFSIRENIRRMSLFFATAIANCNKELFKRPISVREELFQQLLKLGCPKCGIPPVSFQAARKLRRRCPTCGGPLKPVYVTTMRSLLEQSIYSDQHLPEVVLMYVAYERLMSAYCEAYKGMKLVADKFAVLFGWKSFRIPQPELRRYIDEYRLGKMAGETHIPAEEKQALQFIVIGTLAHIPSEEAEKLLSLCIRVCMYGYLFQVLGAVGADEYYESLSAEKSALLDKFNERIRTTLTNLYAETKTPAVKVKVNQTLGGYYAPCLIMPKRCWETGQISKEVTLEPVYRLPIFPRHDMGALQAVFAPVGGGKSLLMSSLACYTILQKHGVVFSLLNDESNSFAYSGIPLFGYSGRTKQLLHILEKWLGVEPQGVPTITLTVLRRGELMDDRDEKNAPTIYDRVVYVDNPRSFKFDYNVVLDELKEVAQDYGFSKAVGMVNVRNLKRIEVEGGREENIDAQVTTNLLAEFSRWRKSHVDMPARIVLDEISYIASSQVILYAGDSLRAGATISDVIKESRRDDVSVEFATQRPLEVPSEFRETTNIFFRDLPMSRDKTRSQIDNIVDSIQLEDPSVRGVVRDINNRGLLKKGHYWFWYHQPTRTVEVVRPCPPTFLLQDKDKTAKKLFKLYEKETGQKVLLESWKQVKVLKAAKTTAEAEPKKKRQNW